MARRLIAPVLILALAAAWLLVMAGPAAAACHVAGFVESEVAVAPGASVELTVELQGRVPSCAGTVDVVTSDGSAVAGDDYDPVEATLTFEEGDDRVEPVQITIPAGATADTAFTVELSNPTGDISSTAGPATVSIVGGGGGEGDAPAGDDTATEEEAPTEDDTATEEEAPTEDETPATADPTADDSDAEDETTAGEDADGGDGGSLGLIVAILVGLAVVAGVVALVARRG